MELVENQYDEELDAKSQQTIIKIEQLSVWTPKKRFWWKKPKPPRTMLLNKVTGIIRQGEFVAILGPSGAGKTTFLVSLAGKSILPSEGTITVNGKNVKQQQGLIEIVPQFDVFIESLTVKEHLIFLIEMKLGSYKKKENKTALNKIINDLQLRPHLDKLIAMLSGGEKRLISLAGSLISSPKVIICDEPTTGLDSYNAIMVIDVLKNLASTGKIVICSVHQPSSGLFGEFSSIMLIAEGQLMFHGDQKECSDLFESLNLRCPLNSNPAEFYISAISTYSESSKNNKNIHQMSERYKQQMITIWHNDNLNMRPHQDNIVICKRNWFKQVYLLFWRSGLTMKIDIPKHLFQLFMCMILPGIALFISFLGVSGTTQRGIQDMRGFLWLLTSEVSFNLSYCGLYAFEEYLPLFKREAGMYSASAFYVSRFINFLPRCILWPITSLVITTPAVYIPNYFETVMEMSAVLIYTALASTAYGLGMGAMFISTGITGDVMPCMDLPLFLMSGAFLRIHSIPVWLLPLRYLSHFYYSLNAMSNVYWRQIEHIDCPPNSTVACLKNGWAVLEENGFSSNFVTEDCIGLLVVLIFWSVIGYIGLKRAQRKGYAY